MNRHAEFLITIAWACMIFGFWLFLLGTLIEDDLFILVGGIVALIGGIAIPVTLNLVRRV